MYPYKPSLSKSKFHFHAFHHHRATGRIAKKLHESTLRVYIIEMSEMYTAMFISIKCKNFKITKLVVLLLQDNAVRLTVVNKQRDRV